MVCSKSCRWGQRSSFSSGFVNTKIYKCMFYFFCMNCKKKLCKILVHFSINGKKLDLGANISRHWLLVSTENNSSEASKTSVYVCVQPCTYIIRVFYSWQQTASLHLLSSETFLFRMSFNQASNSLLVLSSSFCNKLSWPPHFKQLTLGLKHQHPEDVGLQFSSPASFQCSQMIHLVYTVRENMT